MKESARAGISYLRSVAGEWGIEESFFTEHDIHIHIPEGAVPKDGPSAGITLTTAIASLVSDKPVDPSVAMTGEVSLRGAVSAIGGLPEKLMAAERAGVTTVFIPEENMEDLKDVSKDVLNKLDIHPAKDIYDVLSYTKLIQKDLMHAG